MVKVASLHRSAMHRRQHRHEGEGKGKGEYSLVLPMDGTELPGREYDPLESPDKFDSEPSQRWSDVIVKGGKINAVGEGSFVPETAEGADDATGDAGLAMSGELGNTFSI